MKILLTGKDGQLGFELRRSLECLGYVVAVGRADCDLRQPDEVARLVREVAPDIIVNPAAYTAVDKAESDIESAFAVNGEAPRVMAEEAARLRALLIHFSTDYVFDGDKAGCYREDDRANPISVYGKSKLAGEQRLAKASPAHVILRTSWVLGAHGNNFARTMLRLASERDSLSVVADQFGAPTSVSLLSEVTARIVSEYQRKGPVDFPFGTYHVAAGGYTTWYDYARFVLAEALAAGKQLRATPDRVIPIPTSDFPTPAKRPANSRLDTSRLTEAFGVQLADWQDGVRQTVRQILLGDGTDDGSRARKLGPECPG